MLLTALSLMSNPAHAKKVVIDPRTIDKVAIIRFGATLEVAQVPGANKGIGGAIMDAKKDIDTMKALGDGSLKAEAETNSMKAYNTFDDALTKTFGWDVMDLATVRDHADYAKFWDDKTPGINKKMSGWGSGMCPKGIVHFQLPVNQEERDALATALGVEYLALASASISGELEKEKIGRDKVEVVHPAGYVQIKVWKKGEKKPYWKGLATGKPTEDPIAPDGYSGYEREEIIIMAMQNALDKLAIKFAAE